MSFPSGSAGPETRPTHMSETCSSRAVLCAKHRASAKSGESAERSDKSEFYIPNAIQDLIDAGRARVRVLPTDDRWFGVTYREDKPHVEAAIRELVEAGRYPRGLWQ